MEPNLKDMDDYNKPISRNKLKTISIVLIATIAVYITVILIGKLFY